MVVSRSVCRIVFALGPLALAVPAAAQLADPLPELPSDPAPDLPEVPVLPEAVRAMVDAALATGDRAKVATIIELAKQTNPHSAPELDAIHQDFQQQQAAARAEAAAREQERVRNAGLFERWSGSGQIGAFQSTGNSSNVGLSAALTLRRQGIDWSHLLRARADYQRSRGITSREQFLFAYEPRYQISDRVFTYALGQYERDRFQGFTSRYSASGGFGYHLIDGRRIDLTIQAGPAWRRTDFVAGGSDSNLAALATLDFDWRITDRVTFTQDTNMVTDAGGRATVIVEPNNTSLSLVSGLEAKISDRLTTRLSYTVEYNSQPPAGSVTTDTLTRFTFVYGF